MRSIKERGDLRGSGASDRVGEADFVASHRQQSRANIDRCLWIDVAAERADERHRDIAANPDIRRLCPRDHGFKTRE